MPNVLRQPAPANTPAVHAPGTEQSINESTPMSQRTGALRSPIGEGPVRGERGEFKSAAYPVDVTVQRGDKFIDVKLTREDR